MNCSLFDTYFCHDKPGSTCSRIGSKVPAPHIPEGRDPDHQDCDSPLNPIKEGSGMNPLGLTSIPPADLEKGREGP